MSPFSFRSSPVCPSTRNCQTSPLSPLSPLVLTSPSPLPYRNTNSWGPPLVASSIKPTRIPPPPLPFFLLQRICFIDPASDRQKDRQVERLCTNQPATGTPATALAGIERCAKHQRIWEQTEQEQEKEEEV